MQRLGGTPARLPLATSRLLPLQRTRTMLPPRPVAPVQPAPDRPTISPGNNLVKPVYIAPGVLDPRTVDRGPHEPGQVVDPGFGVRGGFVDDKFRLGFVLGAAYTGNRWHGKYPYSYYRSSWPFSYYDYGYNSASYPYGAQTVYYYPAPDTFVSDGPAPEPAAPVRELTPLEKADSLLGAGEPAKAVAAYREYLGLAPDDSSAMRSMALALLDDRKTDQAVAVLAMAYERDPRLAHRPIDAGLLPGGDAELRRRVNTLVSYASKVKTGSAWLAVAVLMQSEGREEVAARMVERAKEAGLSDRVASEVLLALGK